MLHMVLEDKSVAAEHEAVGVFPFSPSSTIRTVSPVIGDLYGSSVGTVCSDSAEQSLRSACFVHEGSMKNVIEDNYAPRLRYQPYPSHRPETYTAPATHFATEMTLGRRLHSYEPMCSIHDERDPISSFTTSLPGNITAYQKNIEEPFYSRNCNNSNNSYEVNQAPFPRQTNKVTNSFAPIYNPNLLQQQPYGSLVYTSTADTSVYSTLPTSSSSLKTHHYLGPQSINMSSSPDARGNQSKDSRKRGTKKRKKKGSNEPQRPVSAYALFFRDTQAAIKAENSSATFGEISKIVASMWDSLSEEDKHVYKQKTENAKRDYLKHLAAFRANMISKGCFDTEEEDSQPLSVLREKMAEQRATTYSPVPQSNPSIIDLTGPGENELGPPFKLHPAYGASSIGMQMSEPQLKLHPLPSVSSSICLPRSLARPISPVATFTKIIVPGKNGAQSTIHVINADGLTTVSGSSPAPSPLSQHIFIRPKMPGISSQDASAIISSSPLPIQLRNIVTHEPRPPIAFLPSKPGQIIKVVPSGTGGVTFTSINSYTEKGLAVKMVDIVKPVQATSQASQLAKNQSQTTTSATSQGQMPILQLLEQESVDGLSQVSNNTSSNASVPVDIVDENDLMQTPRQNLVPSGQLTAEVDLTAMHVQSHISYPTNLGSCDFDFLIKDDAAHLANTRQCVREGCTNLAVSCPYWDNEYCSNECVYSHCRDVFDAWVSTRQVTTSAV